MKYLFIDIRKSDNVYSKHLLNSDSYEFYNIPMNMIRFNKESIVKHVEWIDEIYIVCNSGRTSRFIKNKYFSEYSNIKVDDTLQFNTLKIGENKISSLDNLVVNVGGTDSFNLYSIMRITQIILGTLILSLGGFTLYQIFKYKNKKLNKWPLIILLFFGLNALINGLTSTCTVDLLLRDYLN